ncbi:hypothetical protein V6Z11_D12G196300 [Gossypium hirsutum]
MTSDPSPNSDADGESQDLTPRCTGVARLV